MQRQAALFEMQRKPKRKLMRVFDAGHGVVHFRCQHCGHDDGWTKARTLTEDRRGRACPRCNLAST